MQHFVTATWILARLGSGTSSWSMWKRAVATWQVTYKRPFNGAHEWTLQAVPPWCQIIDFSNKPSGDGSTSHLSASFAATFHDVIICCVVADQTSAGKADLSEAAQEAVRNVTCLPWQTVELPRLFAVKYRHTEFANTPTLMWNLQQCAIHLWISFTVGRDTSPLDNITIVCARIDIVTELQKIWGIYFVQSIAMRAVDGWLRSKAGACAMRDRRSDGHNGS